MKDPMSVVRRFTILTLFTALLVIPLGCAFYRGSCEDALDALEACANRVGGAEQICFQTAEDQIRAEPDLEDGSAEDQARIDEIWDEYEACLDEIDDCDAERSAVKQSCSN